MKPLLFCYYGYFPMKKSRYSRLFTISTLFTIGLAGSFVTANYDAEVSALAASILQQIENDVPPSITTGSNLETPIVDTTNGLIGTIFLKTNDGFSLTSKGLNARLNGGILTKDIQDAISYMYDEKLTKYSTAESFNTEATLRRDEAAKFFSVFARTTMHKTEDATKTCSFQDIGS